MNDRQRILGIDPGSRLTGFGVLDFVADKATYVASGVIQSIDGEFAERLKDIYNAVSELVKDYCPDAVAVESVFVHKNPGSALKLGHARSAAICATFQSDAVVFEYAPREIKLAVVGSGAASKEQVQHMVISILNLEGSPAPDAADALATALCHGHQRRLGARLSKRSAAVGLR
jgi:crossover junction endodeoxyribonuclease RuvC